jgi:hypothetical protein
LLWALLPIALLSLLPHKEARYVIVTIPFLALAGSKTLWTWLSWLSTPDGHRQPAHASIAALWLVLAVTGAALFDVSKFRFYRSENAVRLGWLMAQSGAGGVAAEQLWRFGGRLYLDGVAPLVDLDPGLSDGDPTLRQVLCRPDIHWAALRRDRMSDARRELLKGCGFRTIPTNPSAGYDVYRRF